MRMGFGFGLGLGAQKPAAVSYDTDAQTYFNTLAIAPTTAFKQAVNDFVVRLKAASIWTKLDAVYLLANGDTTGNLTTSSTALINLVAPASYKCTIGGTVHGKDSWGCKTAAGSSYLDTGINLSTGTTKITKNSCFIFYDLSGEVNETSKSELAGYTTNGIILRTTGASGKMLVRLNTGSSQPTLTPAYQYGWIAFNKREGGSYWYKMEGGTETQVTGLTDQNVENASLKIFSGSTDMSTKKLAIMAIGSHLTAGETILFERAYRLLRANIRYLPYEPVLYNAIGRVQLQYNDTDFATEKIGTWTAMQNRPEVGGSWGCVGCGYKYHTQQVAMGVYGETGTVSKIYLWSKAELEQFVYPYTAEQQAEVPCEPSAANIIDISSHILALQGLDYDEQLSRSTGYATDYFWALGKPVGASEEPDLTHHVIMLISATYSGGVWTTAIVRQLLLSAYSFQPGMCQVWGDYIMIKMPDLNQVAIFNKYTFALVETFTQSDEETIGVDRINKRYWFGAPYVAPNYYMGRWNISRFAQSNSYLRTTPGNELEGICVDPQDDTLWISADGSGHGLIDGGNVLEHYDYDNTYLKFARFPEMIPWEDGTLSGLTVDTNGWLAGTGGWASPVLDLLANPHLLLHNVPTITQDGRTCVVQYRGSDSKPGAGATEITRAAVTYYTGVAAGANADWGGVSPTDWGSENVIPESTPGTPYRYIQMKITIT